MSEQRKATVRLTETRPNEYRYCIEWPNGGKAIGSGETVKQALADVNRVVQRAWGQA